jgi:hypothetical protein
MLSESCARHARQLAARAAILMLGDVVCFAGFLSLYMHCNLLSCLAGDAHRQSAAMFTKTRDFAVAHVSVAFG